MENEPKIGLALSSGAARGFAHVGVLKVLEKENISIDYIAGSSMGALVGALYSAGIPLKIMEGLIVSLDRRHWLDWHLSKLGVISGKKIEEIIKLLTRDQKLEDLEIPLAVVATDLQTGELVVFDRGDLTPAVRASISVPGIFPPVNYEGKILVDGGVLCRVPVEEVRNLGADIVIAVDVGLYIEETAINNIFDVVTQCIDIMGRELMKFKVTEADVLIRPDLSSVNLTDFQKAERCILEGEKAARDVISNIKSLLKGRSHIA